MLLKIGAKPPKEKYGSTQTPFGAIFFQQIQLPGMKLIWPYYD